MMYEPAEGIEAYTPDESMVVDVNHSTPNGIVGGQPITRMVSTKVPGVFSVEVDESTVEEEGGTTLVLLNENDSPIAMFKNWYYWRKVETDQR